VVFVNYRCINYLLFFRASRVVKPITAKGFTLKNLSDRPRRFVVDLSSVFKEKQFELVTKSKKETTGSNAIIVLSANEEATWILNNK